MREITTAPFKKDKDEEALIHTKLETGKDNKGY